MKNVIFKISIMGASIMSLVASGIGGGGSGYATFASTADKTSPLAGFNIQSNRLTAEFKTLAVAGELTHNTGSTTITDASFSLVDADGPINGVLSAAYTSLTYNDIFTGDYEYVNSYAQSYIKTAIVYDVTGIVGIVTHKDDMPTSKTITYTGEAEALLQTAFTSIDLKSGTSTINANFGTGKIDVTLNGFNATKQSNGETTTAPVDTIKATGLTLTGNSFTGGTIATSLNGSDVDFVGANATNTIFGNFYGYDNSLSAPDEAGGVVLMQGDEGKILGTFIAD